MANLFREEVVARRAAALFDGVVVRSAPGSAWLAAAVLVLAAMLVALAATGTYARKERAVGLLVPDAGLVRVVAPRNGIVERVHVEVGGTVRRDEVVFTIVSGADGGRADAEQLDLLLDERAALEAQLAAEARVAAARDADLERRAAFARQQVTVLAAQQSTARTRADLLRADLDRLERLRARGHVAANLAEQRLADLLEVQQQELALRRERERAEHEAREFDAERLQSPHHTDIRLGELRARLLAVERAIAAADARWSMVVRAPTGGQVVALDVRDGAPVVADRPVLAIVPAGSTLRAELLVPVRAAGFIAPGQAVRLRYDAYPYQRFGLYPATVTSVSRAVLGPDEQPGAVRLPVPAYRVVADIEQQTVAARDGPIPLQPGLTLQADIVRDRRRFIEWLFDPALAAVRGL